jgi:hypothetical protein
MLFAAEALRAEGRFGTFKINTKQAEVSKISKWHAQANSF